MLEPNNLVRHAKLLRQPLGLLGNPVTVVAVDFQCWGVPIEPLFQDRHGFKKRSNALPRHKFMAAIKNQAFPGFIVYKLRQAGPLKDHVDAVRLDSKVG